MQCAASLHGQFSDLRILVVKEVQDRPLNEVDDAHCILTEVEY